MIKTMRRLLITTVVLGGGAYAFYTFGLSSEAKEGIAHAATTLKTTYEGISEMVDGLLGLTMSDEEMLSAEELTRQKWAEIGY